ncbi:hypothetical protein [Rhodopseudomonas palustris]|uniref:hypothetical protein n=1 Tax=Rhodopseudomonas palustris TaxID=1076 RepID=UPI0020CCF4D9|nr:hypothetical protein [Rhodopseudomonas palustris]
MICRPATKDRQVIPGGDRGREADGRDDPFRRFNSRISQVCTGPITPNSLSADGDITSYTFGKVHGALFLHGIGALHYSGGQIAFTQAEFDASGVVETGG